MTTRVSFSPTDMTATRLAQRLRVAACMGDRFALTMTPDEARALAADLDRLVSAADLLSGAQVERMVAEATNDAYDAALVAVRDQLERATREVQARQKAAKLQAVKSALIVVSGAATMGLIFWGLW